MTHEHLKSFIESAYEHAGDISPKTKGVVRDAVEETLDMRNLMPTPLISASTATSTTCATPAMSTPQAAA